MSGPLKGLRVVEFAGLGPAPLAGQLLADLGAEVVCVDRAAGKADPTDVNRRGKRSLAANLKSAEGLAVVRKLLDRADVLIEGFRPGVMERLGLGPQDVSPRLIYARMTGWGQTGPLAPRAGHDLTYLALTGALHAIGPSPEAPPIPPLNLVADFGGGSMFLIFGILAALYERERSGLGQVVDAAMVEGVPAMMGLIHQMAAQGRWSERRASNWLDGGRPFYRCYACADGKHVAVGPLEPQFFAELLKGLGLEPDWAQRQEDPSSWPEMTARFEAAFLTRTRDEWAALFEGTDACVAPVLTMAEAPTHPQAQARGGFFEAEGVVQASPAPRFGRSAPERPRLPGAPGADSAEILKELGLDAASVEALRRSGAVL